MTAGQLLLKLVLHHFCSHSPLQNIFKASLNKRTSKQWTYDVTLRRVGVTIVAVGKR